MIEVAVVLSSPPYSFITLDMDEEEFRNYAIKNKCEIFKNTFLGDDAVRTTYFIKKGNQWFASLCFFDRELTESEKDLKKKETRTLFSALWG